MNELIQYKGGGYDGCIWEWNYCAYINGEFHIIASSGITGFKNENDWIKYQENESENKDYYIYSLDYTSLLTFSNCSAPSHVVGVAKYLVKHGIDVPVLCSKCGESIEGVYGIGVNPKSMGGVVIDNTEIVCEDCYLDHTCPYCGGYWDDVGSAYTCCESEC